MFVALPIPVPDPGVPTQPFLSWEEHEVPWGQQCITVRASVQTDVIRATAELTGAIDPESAHLRLDVIEGLHHSVLMPST